MKKPTNRTSRKSPRKRNRDYKAEYAKRINNPAKQTLPLSVRRGHARAGERPRPPRPALINPKSPEEAAVRMISRGSTLKAAAKSEGVSEEHLRRYLKENTDARRVGGRWQVSDVRPRQFPFYSNGRLVSPRLSIEEVSKAARYMQAVKAFLPEGDPALLAPYVGRGVFDIRGAHFLFETDENTLYELDQAGELSFPEYYRIVS